MLRDAMAFSVCTRRRTVTLGILECLSDVVQLFNGSRPDNGVRADQTRRSTGNDPASSSCNSPEHQAQAPVQSGGIVDQERAAGVWDLTRRAGWQAAHRGSSSTQRLQITAGSSAARGRSSLARASASFNEDFSQEDSSQVPHGSTLQLSIGQIEDGATSDGVVRLRFLALGADNVELPLRDALVDFAELQLLVLAVDYFGRAWSCSAKLPSQVVVDACRYTLSKNGSLCVTFKKTSALAVWDSLAYTTLDYGGDALAAGRRILV